MNREFDAALILGIDADEAFVRMAELKDMIQHMGDQRWFDNESSIALKRATTRAGELRNLLSRLTSKVHRLDMNDEGVQKTKEALRTMMEQLDAMKLALKDESIDLSAIYAIEEAMEKTGFAMTNFAEQYNVKHRSVQGSTLGTLNVVRLLQDAPYGIIGMANNINELALSFAILHQRTDGTNGALKAMLAGFKSWPMVMLAAISVITGMLLKKDALIGKMEDLAELSGIISASQRNVNQAFRDFNVMDPSRVYANLTEEGARAIDETIDRNLAAERAARDAHIAQKDMLMGMVHSAAEAGNANAQFLRMISRGIEGTFDRTTRLANARIDILREHAGQATIQFAREIFKDLENSYNETLGDIPRRLAHLDNEILDQQQRVATQRARVRFGEAEAYDTLIDMEYELANLQTIHAEELADLQVKNIEDLQAEAEKLRELGETGEEIRQQLGSSITQQQMTMIELLNQYDTFGSMQEAIAIEVQRRQQRRDRIREQHQENIEERERRRSYRREQLLREQQRLEGRMIQEMRQRIAEYLRGLEDQEKMEQHVYRMQMQRFDGQMRNMRNLAQFEQQMRSLREGLYQESTTLTLLAIENEEQQANESYDRRVEDARRFFMEREEMEAEQVRLQERRLALEQRIEQELSGLSGRARERVAAQFDDMRKALRDEEMRIELGLVKFEEGEEAMTAVLEREAEARALITERAAVRRRTEMRIHTEQIRSQIKDIEILLAEARGPMDVRGLIASDRGETEREMSQIQRRMEELMRVNAELSEEMKTASEEMLPLLETVYNENLQLYEAYTQQRERIAREAARRERYIWLQFGQDLTKEFGSVVSDAANVAKTLFDIWKSNREAQLRMEGRTSEQINEILENEGKRRFENMKNLAIAEAVVNTLGAGVAAFRSGIESGLPWPLNMALGSSLLAGTLATGYAQVQKIRSMTIGSGPPGGTSGASVGGFTTLNQSVAAGRIAHFEAARSPAGHMGNAVDGANRYTDRRINQIAVTYDDRTAGHINQIGMGHNDRVRR